MFKIDSDLVEQEAATEAVYQRGKLYYSKDRIRSLRWNHVEKCITGEVRGVSGIYETNIWFEPNGNFHRVNCTCPAFHKFDGLCKHLVATLIAAKAHEKAIGKLVYTDKAEKKSEDIVNVNDEFFKSVDKYYRKPTELLNLEVTYIANHNASKTELEHFLKFRIGQERLYVISNIKEFLDSVDRGDRINFGKQFEFVPDKHKFSKIDLELMQFLRKLQNIENSFFESTYYKSEPKSLFVGKELKIPNGFVNELFGILEKKEFISEILGETYISRHIEEAYVPINIEIIQANNKIIAKSMCNTNFVFLSDDGKYLLLGEDIVMLSSRQQEFMPIVLKLFDRRLTSVIKNEYRERFFSQVIPCIQKICNVKIGGKVKDKIVEADLETKIYLDVSGKNVTAIPIFKYDDYEINPFLDRTEYKEETIIVRDVLSEKKVIAEIEDMNFNKKKEAYRLSTEEKIFDFVYNDLSKLQDFAKIYYSDAFKKMKIRNPKEFKSGVSLNQESDLLEFTFEHEAFGPDEYSKVLNAIKQKKKFYRLKDGSFLPLESFELNSAMSIMEDLGIEQLENTVVKLPKYHAMFLGQKLKEYEIKQIEKDALFNNFVEKLSNSHEVDYTMPKNLNGDLRDYQKKGFKWLKTLASYGMGGILADDMGLGKTIQAIGFLLSEKERATKIKTSLVVAPTSLVYNWEAECKKFAPNLNVGLLIGTKANRRKEINKMSEYDLMITSYGLIRRDIDLYGDRQFEYCFLDEAQHIKNPYSKGAKAVKQIEAKNRFALTGTPMENSLSELWSIFDFIMPGYLSTHSKFVEKYEGPIVKKQDKEAMKLLTNQIKPFIMRRMKSEVLLELPEKIETQITTELTQEQKKVYMAFLKQAKGEMSQEIKENGLAKSHIKILTLLTRLRQLCCDPNVFLENYSGGSAKMDLLEEIVAEAISGNHRMLIFSQFTSMLDEIGERLQGMNIDYFRLDGSTLMKRRGDMVNSFNDGENSVFLISLKAGGTGLNLTGADMVIHFDPWWNPAVEEQATDRAYRMGQNQKVQVLKLIAKGTIEEKIAKLQKKKKEMAEAVLKPGENMLSKMTEEEIKELFDM